MPPRTTSGGSAHSISNTRFLRGSILPQFRSPTSVGAIRTSWQRLGKVGNLVDLEAFVGLIDPPFLGLEQAIQVHSIGPVPKLGVSRPNLVQLNLASGQHPGLSGCQRSAPKQCERDAHQERCSVSAHTVHDHAVPMPQSAGNDAKDHRPSRGQSAGQFWPTELAYDG